MLEIRGQTRAGVAALLLCLTAGCSGVPVRAVKERVVILGFDGADPKLLNRWIAEGKLPHFAELARSGTVQPLGTTEPPESPVAWASFATGTNPGKHGIFDFLKGDRKTYVPDIGLVDVQKPKFLFHTALGSLAWSALLAGAGYALGAGYEMVDRVLDPVTWVVLGVVLALYLRRVIKGTGGGKGARARKRRTHG